MKSELEDRGDGRRAVTIRAEWPEVAAEYEDVSAGYAEHAMAGFRPGRAPRAVIEKRFRQRIREEFTARCGPRLAREALRDRGLRFTGPIAVIEIRLEPRREFSFTAEFIPPPVFELPDYAAIPLAGETADARRDELAEWLLSRTPGEVPAALVRQEFERNGESGADPGSESWTAASRRAKLATILGQIAAAEGIEADRRDVEARIEKVAAESGLRPDELRRKLDREDGLASLQSLLLAEQTLDYLMEKAGSRSEGLLRNHGIARGRGKPRPGRPRPGETDQNRRKR
ncbi:MAG TPA: trigger factor [Thermoanaerobaculia bacterium]|nr:trigger factor [Thermoanaerobaculia bacterium]